MVFFGCLDADRDQSDPLKRCPRDDSNDAESESPPGKRRGISVITPKEAFSPAVWIPVDTIDTWVKLTACCFSESVLYKAGLLTKLASCSHEKKEWDLEQRPGIAEQEAAAVQFPSLNNSPKEWETHQVSLSQVQESKKVSVSQGKTALNLMMWERPLQSPSSSAFHRRRLFASSACVMITPQVNTLPVLLFTVDEGSFASLTNRASQNTKQNVHVARKNSDTIVHQSLYLGDGRQIIFLLTSLHLRASHGLFENGLENTSRRLICMRCVWRVLQIQFTIRAQR